MRRWMILIPILICWLVPIGIAGYSYNRQKLMDDMNALELHYDADNYFLMIDETHSLAGFYYGIAPLNHMTIKTDAPAGVYEAYFHNGDMFLELISVDATIQVPLTKKQFDWIDQHYKDGYPALVFGG